GYEWDAIVPGCATPPLEVLFHHAGTGKDGDADAVTFRQPGGGRVFSAGSNMFANMLDSYNDSNAAEQVADPRIQAFTNALLADFSAAGTCGAGTSITGKGSSLQNIAQTKVWGPGFEALCPGVKISYVSAGSGAGMTEWNYNDGEGPINTEFSFIGTD